MWQVWLLPVLLFASVFALAVPIGLYMAKVFEGRLRLPNWLRWIESKFDTGPQNWKQYAFAFMAFNFVAFVIGYAILALQPYLPLNPDGKKMLAPTTIFHSAISFLTNTNQQHYSGEVHFSYFTQIFFVCWKQALSPIIGMAALLAIIRGLRGDKHMGNFYLDMWRGTVYIYLPLCLIVGVILMGTGVPMTLEGNASATIVDASAATTDADGHAQPQQIARGPVAAILAVKQFGTNGGGFFGANRATPLRTRRASATC